MSTTHGILYTFAYKIVIKVYMTLTFVIIFIYF